MKRLVAAFTIMVYFIITFSGCTWMGRMTAKTERGVKKAADGITSMDDKFKNGYEEEKKKE